MKEEIEEFIWNWLIWAIVLIMLGSYVMDYGTVFYGTIVLVVLLFLCTFARYFYRTDIKKEMEITILILLIWAMVLTLLYYCTEYQLFLYGTIKLWGLFLSTFACYLYRTVIKTPAKIRQLREKIREYRPYQWTARDAGDGFERPSKVRLEVFGVLNSGKSSFLNSLHFAFNGYWEEIYVEKGNALDGGETLFRNPVKLSDNVTTFDTRGLVDLSVCRVPEVIAQITGKRGLNTRSYAPGEKIDCPIFILKYSWATQETQDCTEFLKTLVPEVRKHLWNETVSKGTVILAVLLFAFGVAWYINNSFSAKIRQLRKKIRCYRPNQWTERDACDGFIIPSKVRLGVFGVQDSGKSSFLNSLRFAFKGGWKQVYIERGRGACGGESRFRDPTRLSNYVTTFDTQGLVDLCTDKVPEVMAELAGKRGTDPRSHATGDKIDCPIFILKYSPIIGIGYCTTFLRALVPEVRKQLGAYPIMVVTFADDIANRKEIIVEITSAGMEKDSLFFIENYTYAHHEMNSEKHIALLEILEACIKRADDNITFRWRTEKENYEKGIVGRVMTRLGLW